jgi:hypothetical protein
MKKISSILLAIVLFTQIGMAQTNTTNSKPKKRVTITWNDSEADSSKVVNKPPRSRNSAKNAIRKQVMRKVMANQTKKSNKGYSSKFLALQLGFNQMVLNSASPSFPAKVVNTNNPIVGAAGNNNSLVLQNMKSVNVGLYFLNYRFPIVGRQLNIHTALGVNWYNYRFDNQVTFASSTNPAGAATSTAVYNTLVEKQSKNKIGLSYVTLPVMLQVKPNGTKGRLSFGAGASVGYLLKSWNKTKSVSGSKNNETINGVFNPWQVNALAEIGIGKRLKLYGNYGLQNMFLHSVDAKPVSFGVQLFGF